ncbi:hypothetical protein [Streptomyces albireticuli]|uniref:hypothetical protein n=1 Tax=Streptomyces albireticuli TaxID=1940 RepID=UPI0036AEDC8C
MRKNGALVRVTRQGFVKTSVVTALGFSAMAALLIPAASDQVTEDQDRTFVSAAPAFRADSGWG